MITICLRKHCSLVFLLTLGLMFGSFAQSNKSIYKKIKKKAEGYFIDEIFKGALPLYLQLEQINPGDPEVNYKIGVCYLHSEFKSKSIPHFEKAKEKDKSRNYSDVEYYLGVAYHYDHQFDKAIDYYNKYKIAVDTNSEYGKQILPTLNKYIQNCHVGKLLVLNPIKAKIEHLNTNINTVYSETYPLISSDENTLYFSSQKHETTGGQIDEETEEYYEDIYMSTRNNNRWSLAKHIGQINSFKHDAPLSLSADSKKLYFYTTDPNGATDIYYSELINGEWSKPINMGPNINSTSGEFGASISSDGKTFYFSSDRPGGYGGMDIYISQLQADGTWGPAINIGTKINTSFDEESPFILPDGKVLYFSSDGPNSIGGLDIFKTTYHPADSGWSKPMNMGYPLNTAEHEFHVSWTPDGKKGYFSSFRKDTYGEEDIYFVELYDADTDTKVYAKENDPSENLNRTFSKPLKGEILKQKAFFDFNIHSTPADFSVHQLQEVADLLSKFPDMLIEISGHTDSIGSYEINQSISRQRANAVYKHLVNKGVDGKRLKTKGYGYNKLLVNGKSTLENGPNRRVEFRVLSNAEFETINSELPYKKSNEKIKPGKTKNTGTSKKSSSPSGNKSGNKSVSKKTPAQPNKSSTAKNTPVPK
jgi:outer membrane protein OmpA-like peptidoglycan-associated protein/tetratricopeptide (TPR) repeat protein